MVREEKFVYDFSNHLVLLVVKKEVIILLLVNVEKN